MGWWWVSCGDACTCWRLGPRPWGGLLQTFRRSSRHLSLGAIAPQVATRRMIAIEGLTAHGAEGGDGEEEARSARRGRVTNTKRAAVADVSTTMYDLTPGLCQRRCHVDDDGPLRGGISSEY